MGDKGIRVTTGDTHKFALASFSRYSSNSFVYPSPQTSPVEFIKALVAFVKANKHKVIIPTHSRDIFLIAKYRSDLEPYVKVPLHNYESLIKAHDKSWVMKLAGELDIPVPKTLIVNTLGELKRHVSGISFPAVIKLRDATSSVGISYAHTEQELVEKFQATLSRFNLSAENYPLVQEYIKGDGYGVSLLFNHGKLRAKFTHKRIREYPPSGGPSTYRISVTNPEMEEAAIKLLRHMDWHGVAMVEFKLNKQSMKPVLLEVNPRFWGSLNQAICSGVDFPYLLYRMAIDGDVEPVLNYKLGIKTRVLFLDFLSVLRNVRTSPWKHFVGDVFRPCADDIINLSDPLPILGLFGLLRHNV